MIKHRLLTQTIKLINYTEKIKTSRFDEAGFTIIESLVAILVISILMVGIAPVIAISVATRVQARRVELATQAARTYIDGVRAGTILAPVAVSLNETTASTNSSGVTTYTFNSQRNTNNWLVPAPGTTLSCNVGNGYCNTTASKYSLYCVDRDNSGCANTSHQDYVIQAYSSNNQALTSTTNQADQGYVLAVRVYRSDSFQNGITLQSSSTGYKSSPFAGGLAQSLSGSTAPLIELTTEITDQNTNFQDYCTRFGGCY